MFLNIDLVFMKMAAEASGGVSLMLIIGVVNLITGTRFG